MNPRILLAPNIPKPLHGIAPRVVLGQAWWDTQRKLAYENAGQKCEACGTTRSQAWPKPWLEAHETYDYDYSHGRLTFVRLVCLCPACHMFIHSGRLNMLLDQGEITEALYERVVEHGLSIIRKARLTRQYEHRHDSDIDVPWEDWRMVINGKEYGPSSRSYTAWMAGKWRNWKP